MSQAADATHAHAPTSTGIDHKKLIMWLFLASDCMFFGTLISTHLLYRKLYPTGFTDAEGHQQFIQKLFNIELTSFSTFILLMSSFLMALAVSAMHKGQLKSFRRNVLGVIFFGLIFLGCQVYEFTHFYHQGLTIQNSVLGSTFYVLTGTHGTHGCHVALGVLWLCLMYVRSFKVASDTSWFGKQLLHTVTLLVALLLSLKVTLGLVHGLQVEPTIGAGIAHFFSHEFIYIALALVAYGALAFYFAKPAGPVQFNETNAIDVESMGLYWHFVDIVWIVIFTAVYLVEYLGPSGFWGNGLPLAK